MIAGLVVASAVHRPASIQRRALRPGPTPDRPPGPAGAQGAWLGTPAELAATATWTPLTVSRYRRTATVHIAVIRCLWPGSLGYTPVQVVLVRDPASTKPYGIALVSTDLSAGPSS